jgi:ubiquitin carboxyl-terminal hydrolase 8
MRDDSLIVDFFQGQFRNRLQCLTCRNVRDILHPVLCDADLGRQTSTTFNAFMYLTLPIPNKGSKVSIQQCLDLFVKAEVMEKADAW